MWLAEFKNKITDEVFALNDGSKTEGETLVAIRQLVAEFSERTTSKEEISRWAAKYIRKHLDTFSGAPAVADALFPSKSAERNVKVILIVGAGRGRTLIGNLLAERFEKEAITCARIIVTCPADILAIDEVSTEFVLVESEYIIGNLEPWQTIDVSGGFSTEG